MKGIKKIKKESFIVERYIPFGKFILNHFQLDKNILLVKYPKTIAPVPKLRRKIISDNLKILLQNLIETQNINTDLQSEISTEEIKIFEDLLFLSGLTKHLKYKRIDRTIKDALHRYEVLKGGLLAGNQSIELKEELITILNLFVNKNIIDSEEGHELITILT
jgi:hypothetical protein